MSVYHSLGELEEVENSGCYLWRVLVTFAGVFYFKLDSDFELGFAVPVSMMMKIIGLPGCRITEDKVGLRKLLISFRFLEITAN